jgi:hypothetical protein
MDDTKNIHISTRFTTKDPIYLNENSLKSQDFDENTLLPKWAVIY